MQVSNTDTYLISSDLEKPEECDPALALWLIEELLDSQSIDGCRTVFEYLESRREKLVAVGIALNWVIAITNIVICRKTS
jgi:hypothetical protein